MKAVTKQGILAMAAAVLLAYASHAAGAELRGMKWVENGADPTLEVQLSGDARHTTATMEDGLRLRVTFADSSLAAGVADLPGRGPVKGAFPYMSDDGKSVHVDLLMREPRYINVAAVTGGVRIAASASAGAAVAMPAKGAAPAPAQKAAATAAAPAAKPASAAGLNALEGVDVAQLPGNRVQLTLRTSGTPGQPGTFSTVQPPRIAIDLFGTANRLTGPPKTVNTGAVESVTAVQADDRTRVVINLSKSVEFDTRVDPNGVVVVIGPKASAATTTARSASTAKTATFPGAPSAARQAVSSVDFRRGAAGEGKVIVTLTDPKVGIDINEQVGEVVIDFLDTNVPQALEQSLDVMDFATPVQRVDTFQRDGAARIVVKAGGRYQHSAYQAGNVFTIDVKPFVEKEAERKKDEFGYSGDKLSLNFQSIEVRAALQVIADFTGLNFVTSDAVSGNLTLRLRDVPWDQALDIILKTKGLAMRKTGNVVWVAPAEEVASKEKQVLEAQKTVADLEPLVTELISINYAKAKDVAQLLKSIKAVDSGIQSKAFGSVSVGKLETESNSLLSARGSVTVDERTNTLLLQDTPSKIREVKKLIAQLDQPVRQVMIETRIVQASDDFSKNLGARFGITNRNQTFNIPGSSTTNAGDAILTGQLENAEGIYNRDEYLINQQGLNFDLPALPIGNANPAHLAFTLFKVGATHLLALELSALEAEGKGKIIANPRLVTANQKQAKIEQGQERTVPPTGFAEEPTIIEAKLSLIVTPQITPDDSIIMDVDITQDNFAQASNDTVETKGIQTQVLLRNGETVVIGGIYQQQINTSVSKVPMFGDLPLVGALFRRKEEIDQKTELLIFLTPRILSPALNVAGS